MSEHPSLKIEEQKPVSTKPKVDINLGRLRQKIREIKSTPQMGQYFPVVLVEDESLKETVGAIVEIYNNIFNEFLVKLQKLDVKKPEIKQLSEQLTDYSEQILAVLTNIADLLKEKHENANLEREVLTKLRDKL